MRNNTSKKKQNNIVGFCKKVLVPSFAGAAYAMSQMAVTAYWKRCKKRYRKKNNIILDTIVLKGIVVFFISTNSLVLLFSFLLFFINFPIMTISRHRIFRCRSPTAF